jgi:hypothetical protein
VPEPGIEPGCPEGQGILKDVRVGRYHPDIRDTGTVRCALPYQGEPDGKIRENGKVVEFDVLHAEPTRKRGPEGGPPGQFGAPTVLTPPSALSTAVTASTAAIASSSVPKSKTGGSL